MYTVKLLTEAEIEISEACKWYEEQQPGLASKFLKEIDHYLDLIAENPIQFEIKFSYRYHFATLKVFPYFIVYRVEENNSIIYVLSVFHTSRNPINL